MKFNKTIPALLLLPLSLSTNPSFAEDVLEKVEITSEAQNERRQNKETMFFKPYSKHIVGEKTIAEENIPDVAEAIRDVPGVSVTENGAFSKSIKIRGLQGPRVITLIDGVKLSNQGLTHTGSGETGTQDIANVKKIEVIKGSPAVIYDPGASGGVINIITHKAPITEEGLGFKQRLSYDDGYDQHKSTTIIDASNGIIGGRFSYTTTEAKDYKISGDNDKKLAVARSNALNSMQPNALEIKDLGYKSVAKTATIGIKSGKDGIIDLKWDDWTGRDMSLIHGATIGDAIIIQYDRIDRNTQSISYRKNRLGDLNNINFTYSKQFQYQGIGSNAIGVKLDSQQFTAVSDLNFDNLLIKLGAEVINDKAKTNVYSNQLYHAFFTNLEYVDENFTLYGGVRANHWRTNQKLFSDTNVNVAENLVGISGITPAKEDFSPTFAIGAQYSINEQNNLSLNLNTTHRKPNLLERYAFGGTIGGGLKMKSEEGNHAEISWKYLDPKLSITSSVFYSDFKNYIWTKQKRRIINHPALNACIGTGACNPATGDYDNREEDFFQSNVKYYNSKKVTNWGMELDLLYSAAKHEIIFNSSFNEIRSDDVFVKSAANPLDSNLSYRYEFNHSWKPWVKVKGQYVFDFPKVDQHKGFAPYLLTNIYSGFKKNGFVVNGGIRNLFDKTYRAAYSGINGLSRTYFINIGYEWHS